jgi:hypothetical protein
MLWFKTFYEAVGLPKLNGVAINGDLAVRPDYIGAIFFHRTL